MNNLEDGCVVFFVCTDVPDHSKSFLVMQLCLATTGTALFMLAKEKPASKSPFFASSPKRASPSAQDAKHLVFGQGLQRPTP